MRRIASILIGLVCAASAHAEIVSFEYTGVIKSLREFPYYAEHSDEVTSSVYIPGGVRIGDNFHGSFTIDTGVPLVFSDAQTVGYWAPWQSTPPVVKPATITFDKTGTSAVFKPQAPNISIGRAAFEFVQLFVTSENMQLILIDFFNNKPENLSDFSIPNNFDLSAWSSPQVSLSWFSPEYGYSNVSMTGALTSFTKVSAVPEPESYAMFLAGLAVVSGVATRRKRLASSAS